MTLLILLSIPLIATGMYYLRSKDLKFTLHASLLFMVLYSLLLIIIGATNVIAHLIMGV